MRLDIVTPEKQLLSEEVSMVELPGMDGDMTVMGDHAPMVTTLRPGVLKVHGGENAGSAEYIVIGGFAEISASGTSVLAEQAMPKDEATREIIEEAIEEAKTALELAPETGKTAAALRVNDLGVLLSHHG